MRDPALTLCMVAHIPDDGIAAFQEYEASVLPLLGDHNGELLHRYRNAEGTMEMHIVRFEVVKDFDMYRTSEIHKKFAALLEKSGASVTVHEVSDIV